MNPLDAALLDAWHRHLLPRLVTPRGRAQLARRVLSRSVLAARPPSPANPKPLRSFTLVLRANDRRLPDDNTVGAVALDPDSVARLCAPIHLPPPGVSRAEAARLLGIAPQSLTARVRAGHLLKHQPFPTVRANRKHHEPPRPNIYYHAPATSSPPYHVHPVADVQSADWGTLNQHLHLRPRNLPRNWSLNHPRLAGDPKGPASPPSAGWSQTLHRTVRQLRPQKPTPQYERFEWLCPHCDQYAQRLYWPFRPLTLPAYLGFDFHQLAPELPPPHIAHLTSQIEHQHLPLTPGFTCRRCLAQQFGPPGLTYESSEFTSHHGHTSGATPRNTWHLFIQRLTMGMLRGHEVQPPTPGNPPV